MVDTEPLYWDVARKLASQYGSPVTDATLRKMMGVSRLDAMNILAADCGIKLLTPQQLLIHRERELLARFSAGVEPMPGLLELLERFQGRLRFAIATSAPRTFVDAILPALRLQDRFEVVQTGDQIARGKPDPQIYLTTMEKLHVAASECIVLEDSHAGTLAAHRAGAYVIAVPTELTSAQDFSFTNAQVRNLSEASSQIEMLMQGKN